ncbi:MAG: DNA double-strand break repair nuclease NurA [Acidilobus sp.]|nr:DNA double-strand break repair nuclease NurA [Acidilobus sp.]MCG2890141.1 DNA double-strand break repair nuclease NurA [Acidilobus sp.]
MSLVPYALESRDLIRRILDDTKAEKVCDIPWHRLEVAEGVVSQYSAEDGGLNVRRLRTYTVVAVKAWGARFGGRGVPQATSPKGFVGLILPQDFKASERRSLYREILEAEAARDVAPTNGIALFDGTPPIRWGSVGARVTWDEALEFVGRVLTKNKDIAERLTRTVCESPDPECVAKAIEDSKLRPFSANLLLRLAYEGRLDEVAREAKKDGLKNSWILALESLERLIVVKRTIEHIWAQGSTPVFVVKTSRSTSFCNSTLPDIHIIEDILRSRGDIEPGFTARLFTNVNEYFGLKKTGGPRLYPAVNGVSDFYQSKVAVLSTFVRLRRGGFIFKVEALYRKDLVESADEVKLAGSLLSRLATLPLSGEGYPLALMIADSNARISESEMDGVLRALGADLVPESRSVLRV